MPKHEPIAYTYDASIHCPECAFKRFGTDPQMGCVPLDATDSEGNPVGAVAPWDELLQDGHIFCDTCGDLI